MRAERFSPVQETALLGIFAGWRWGVDGRTERALLGRGLITIEPMRTVSGKVWMLPALTPAGYAQAHRLRRAQRRQATNVLPFRSRLNV